MASGIAIQGFMILAAIEAPIKACAVAVIKEKTEFHSVHLSLT